MSSKPTVFITGASSFMGAHICHFLAPHCRIIGGYYQTKIHFPQVQSLRLDLTNRKDIDNVKNHNIDYIVHVAGKIKPSAHGLSAYQTNRLMMKHLLSLEKPMIYASSTAVHWEVDIPYVKARQEDEQELKSSGLPFVILRPCAPYGPSLKQHQPKHKESFQTLVDIVKKSPVIPILGDGQYLRQPVHVYDFAVLILHAIQNGLDQTAFDVAGSQAYTFTQIIRILQGSLHRKQPLIYIPKRIALAGSRLFPNLETSLVSVMDTSEAFDVSLVQNRIPLRSFGYGHLDLLI